MCIRDSLGVGVAGLVQGVEIQLIVILGLQLDHAGRDAAALGDIVCLLYTSWAARGEKVVLVRLETSPEDIEGMKAAQGILTAVSYTHLDVYKRQGRGLFSVVDPASWCKPLKVTNSYKAYDTMI